MAMGRKRRAAAAAKAAEDQQAQQTEDREDTEDTDRGDNQVPIVKPGSWVDQPPEHPRQFTLAEAREEYGHDGERKWCVNCKNLNFDAAHGLYIGACILRPRKQAKVEMDFTCEEFEKADDL